ncbi:hypothetical protein RR48_02437 [Papilio machaon]|uniref:Uncharacterized protein n=1 Tax=Papilio machaon TaxID=76193 RepID=A0A0N0PEL6_PAPMA|nr:hypothetical protein RR48_02437 [Papilio machaon]
MLTRQLLAHLAPSRLAIAAVSTQLRVRSARLRAARRSPPALFHPPARLALQTQRMHVFLAREHLTCKKKYAIIDLQCNTKALTTEQDSVVWLITIASSRKNNCCVDNRYDEVYFCFGVRGLCPPPPHAATRRHTPPPHGVTQALLVWKSGMVSLPSEGEYQRIGSTLALFAIANVCALKHVHKSQHVERAPRARLHDAATGLAAVAGGSRGGCDAGETGGTGERGPVGGAACGGRRAALPADCDAPDAPGELLAEFLSAILRRQYAEALRCCRLILQYEPHNATARGFCPLLRLRLRTAGTRRQFVFPIFCSSVFFQYETDDVQNENAAAVPHFKHSIHCELAAAAAAAGTARHSTAQHSTAHGCSNYRWPLQYTTYDTDTQQQPSSPPLANRQGVL